MGKKAKSKPQGLPSEAELLEFVQASGGKAGKREIARAFDIKGGDRIALKAMTARFAPLAEAGIRSSAPATRQLSRHCISLPAP